LSERVSKLRLADYLFTKNLLDSFHSAYIKHYFTKTTLLSVHCHIIKAMNHQQVTCLTLLDLSAAFDTIDHFKSSVFKLLDGVPQGSGLGPLLFILYTIALSTVISNSAANHHHLHADDINFSYHS